MEENKLFNDRYFLERLLGRGNFSEVWLAKDVKTDIQVALKIYAPATGLDDTGLNVFAREFSLVVNANHKNLLKPLYYDSCERKPYLVLPFCKEGSIMKLVGKFSEEEAWRLIRDVASGLAWLHAMNPPIVHQDIKPDNIMIGDNGDFMITDFGVSTHLKSTLRKSLSAAFSSAGTIAYMAPERFGKDNTPIMANDVYSLGATVFEMLTGDTPFGDNGGLIQKNGADVPDLRGDYSEQLKKVVAKCLKTNPWERPTAEQLEKYAIAALNGEAIRFVDEKTIWQTHKKSILTGALLVVVLLAVGIGFVQQKNHRIEVLKNEQKMEYLRDSIQAEITDLVSLGDSLYLIGDIHDEGYESAYIEAYDSYNKAVSFDEEFLNSMELAGDSIKEKMSRLESKLYESYVLLLDKAELFEDEADVANEFKERALRIRAAIDPVKFDSFQKSEMSDSLRIG